VHTGLEIVVSDPDDDYLGLDIAVTTHRFRGSTFIFGGNDEPKVLAESLTTWLTRIATKFQFELGTMDPHFAGGFCTLALSPVSGASCLLMQVLLRDDPGHYSPAECSVEFRVEVAALQRFVADLWSMHRTRSGTASIRAV